MKIVSKSNGKWEHMVIQLACATDAESSGNLTENCFVSYINKFCKKQTDYFSYHI
jgi:hypothetical protein